MEKLSVKAVFNRRNKLTIKGTAPIHIEIYKGGRNRIRKFVHTGIFLRKSDWDAKNGWISANHVHYPHINKVLKDMIKKVEDFDYNLINKNETITESKLEEFLKGQDIGGISFLEFFKIEIDPLLKRGTRKEHHYTYNLLSEFRRQILFDDINLSLIQDFDRYMKHKKLKQNTIYKHHQHIHRFLRLAIQKEKFPANKNPYLNFKTTKEKSDRINLSLEELKKIEELEITGGFGELQLTKDLFLFSCYTGLRYSDVESLQKIHLIDGPDGISIHKKMEKVPKPVTLPLNLLFNGKSRVILEKYLPKSYDFVFPRISNQNVNRQLKVIAQLTKIPIRLTFHISRHTFGTMLADFTQNPYLIMDLMGHADIKTSMIYIHRSQERINRQLRTISWNI